LGITGYLMVVISALLLAAHFLRAAYLPLIVFCLAFPLLLLIRRRWAVRVVQAILLLGALEWSLTAVAVMIERREAGSDWLRGAAILGAVAVFNAAAAFILQSRPFRERYRPGREGEGPA